MVEARVALVVQLLPLYAALIVSLWSVRQDKPGCSGPSLPPVLPALLGTVATSDSLPGFVAVVSGFTLMRFPTVRRLLRRTEQGLSG
jgi:hypothetical protein